MTQSRLPIRVLGRNTAKTSLFQYLHFYNRSQYERFQRGSSGASVRILGFQHQRYFHHICCTWPFIISVPPTTGKLNVPSTRTFSSGQRKQSAIMETRIVKIPTKGKLGRFSESEGPQRLEQWNVHVPSQTISSALQEAADYLRKEDIPVAFPTETVYGLGADATRSSSVKGIYSAKGRPSDNPLIVHVCDLEMLRDLLKGTKAGEATDQRNTDEEDLIPEIYKPLIQKYWPGPLTILLPNPTPSKLAPEVTAGLTSFGVRMPSSSLALSLIKLAGVPLAAPSANASTKPSPTLAQHVKDDLDGRIELILDGGSCDVGVESTVVDGMCDPPVVLRPGGIGMDELRSCPGWENAVKAYKDASEEGKSAPRAPGMKYKHYSPKARVVLYESTYLPDSTGIESRDIEAIETTTNGSPAGAQNGHSKRRRIGVIRTQRWAPGAGLQHAALKPATALNGTHGDEEGPAPTAFQVSTGDALDEHGQVIGEILDIDLGKEIRGIAQGIFSALRELDRRGVDVILVDGIADDMDIAAAVMNRLRKAASEIRS